MNVIIHDLEEAQFKTIFHHINADTQIIGGNGKIENCMGCFGCWIKTPGKCVIKDNYNNMGMILAQADKVIIISKCCYGGYSPFVKNILDRSISFLMPFFKTRNDETHHRQRYKKTWVLSAYFYGEHILQDEMETAKDLIKANTANFYVPQYSVSFHTSPEELCSEGEIQ